MYYMQMDIKLLRIMEENIMHDGDCRHRSSAAAGNAIEFPLVCIQSMSVIEICRSNERRPIIKSIRY